MTELCECGLVMTELCECGLVMTELCECGLVMTELCECGLVTLVVFFQRRCTSRRTKRGVRHPSC